MVAILYSISDLGAVLTSNGSFPLAVVYAQATGSDAGTFGLLLILFLSIMICVVGTFLTVCLNSQGCITSLPCRSAAYGGLWRATTPRLFHTSSLVFTKDSVVLFQRPSFVVSSGCAHRFNLDYQSCCSSEPSRALYCIWSYPAGQQDGLH